MARECVTHHHACDCREARFREIEKALRAAIDELRRCYEDDGCTEQETEDQTAHFEKTLRGC